MFSFRSSLRNYFEANYNSRIETTTYICIFIVIICLMTIGYFDTFLHFDDICFFVGRNMATFPSVLDVAVYFYLL